MKQKNEKKTHSSKNLSIATRITITTALGILIPLLIVVTFSSVFLNTMSSYFNFSTVTTNSYSMLNQIQWSQTMSSISNELITNDTDKEKIEKLQNFVSPIEEIGSQIYIECDNNAFYSTSQKSDILEKANSIVPIDTETNTNYFSDNGIVIVTHCQNDNNRYLVLIVDDNYTVTDTSTHYTAQDFSSLMFGKTGLFIFYIILVFSVSIVILSIITSKIITNPLKKLSDGANQIANGNLDYTIDYESTNEIGTTVNAFNHMTERLKESIEEKNQIENSRKEMIAGVAHDLRTPLTSAKGYVEGLLDGIANTPEKEKRYLETIYSSTCDMEKLLDDLMTISRLELGKIQLQTDRVNINDFLNHYADDIAVEMEKQGIDFTYSNTCDDETYVDLDGQRFGRVLANIFNNSVKYKKPDVKGAIELSVQSYQKSVIISIADNGIGVDSETLPKIFDSFVRADKARSNVREGSGIGLSVCKRIVELHGGHIWATGKEGVGLTIFISLQRGTNCHG